MLGEIPQNCKGWATTTGMRNWQIHDKRLDLTCRSLNCRPTTFERPESKYRWCDWVGWVGVVAADPSKLELKFVGRETGGRIINPEPQMWLTMIQSVGMAKSSRFSSLFVEDPVQSWLRSDCIISHSNGVDFPWSLRMRMRGNSETGGSYTVAMLITGPPPECPHHISCDWWRLISLDDPWQFRELDHGISESQSSAFIWALVSPSLGSRCSWMFR